MYMTHVCFYVCCNDCVGVCGNVCCVAAVVKDSGYLVLKYVVCLCKGCDGCCVFCLYCDARRCWEVYGMYECLDVVCLCLVCISWQFSMLHSV